MVSTTSPDVGLYLKDRHAFRLNELTLPDGRRLAEAIEPWQEEHVFSPLDELDQDGRWRYRLLYFQLARGHAKSWMCAAEALTVAIYESDARVYLAAADQEQAGLIYEHLVGIVRRNPRLSSGVTLGKYQATVSANGSTIRVLSSDAPSVYGLGGTGRVYVAILDELWAHKNGELWTALWSATGKVPRWRVVVASNAGYDFQSVAWRVREIARAEAWGYLYAPDGPVAGWLTPEWLEQMRSSLPPDFYQRLVENRWVEGSGSFITREQLEKCIDPNLEMRMQGESEIAYVAGVDFGRVHDATAIAVCHQDRTTQRIVLDYLTTFRGSKTSPVEIEAVEAAMVEAARRFRLRRVIVDPHEMRSTVQRYRGRLPLKEFEMTSASVQLLSRTMFELLASSRFRMFHHPDFERELLAMNVVTKSYGWRIDHPAGGRSDMVSAVSLCVQDLLRGNTASIIEAVR